MLDRDFGIDAFFELEQEGKESTIVSIDLTLRQFKGNQKANIVFPLPKDFPAQARFEKGQLASLTNLEEKTFLKYVNNLA